MTAVPQRFEPFRRHHSRDEPSWLPLIAVILLGAFDVWIIGFLVYSLWRMS